MTASLGEKLPGAGKGLPLVAKAVTSAKGEVASARVLASLETDILSQAVTGEWLGMLNYAALANAARAPGLAGDCVAQAERERRHALALQQAALQLGYSLALDPDANYWGRIRGAFNEYLAKGEWLAGFFIQELLLESAAVALYGLMAEKLDAPLGALFARLESDERGHAEHGVSTLALERQQNPAKTDELLAEVFQRVVPLLMQLADSKDSAGHCGICAGSCMKLALPQIGVEAAELRGRILERIMTALDELGVPGEESLTWLAKLRD